MKKIALYLSSMMLLLSMTSSTEVTYPSVVNKAFQVGEKLRYRVTYGFMDAGEAILELKSTTKKGANRELIHAVGTGRTLGGFNAFYKVTDTYETYLDKKGVFPWFFVRRVNEGGYKINQDYFFHRENSRYLSWVTQPHRFQNSNPHKMTSR